MNFNDLHKAAVAPVARAMGDISSKTPFVDLNLWRKNNTGRYDALSFFSFSFSSLFPSFFLCSHRFCQPLYILHIGLECGSAACRFAFNPHSPLTLHVKSPIIYCIITVIRKPRREMCSFFFNRCSDGKQSLRS